MVYCFQREKRNETDGPEASGETEGMDVSPVVWILLGSAAVVLLLISGPSMFIAWRKLRRRDVGPVLNANGWAINAKALVNTKFGKTLTSLAKFPKLTAVDENARKARNRRIFWGCFCSLVVGALLVLWLFNFLAPKCPSPLKRYQPAPETVIPSEVEESPAAEGSPEA